MAGRTVRVVAAVVRDGAKVFAVRRAAHLARGGLWEFPGGKVEPGETDEVALAREIAEELGWSIVVGERLDAATHAYPDITITLVAYACRARLGDPELREHDAMRWLTSTTLTDLAWAPADVPLLPAVQDWLRRPE